MVYTFLTVLGQTRLGPGPSMVTFFEGETDHKMTPVPLGTHFGT